MGGEALVWHFMGSKGILSDRASILGKGQWGAACACVMSPQELYPHLTFRVFGGTTRLVQCVTKHTLTWDTLPSQNRQGDRPDLLCRIPACLSGIAHVF